MKNAIRLFPVDVGLLEGTEGRKAEYMESLSYFCVEGEGAMAFRGFSLSIGRRHTFPGLVFKNSWTWFSISVLGGLLTSSLCFCSEESVLQSYKFAFFSHLWQLDLIWNWKQMRCEPIMNPCAFAVNCQCFNRRKKCRVTS